jgi:hypothetical protein
MSYIRNRPVNWTGLLHGLWRRRCERPVGASPNDASITTDCLRDGCRRRTIIWLSRISRLAACRHDVRQCVLPDAASDACFARCNVSVGSNLFTPCGRVAPSGMGGRGGRQEVSEEAREQRMPQVLRFESRVAMCFQRKQLKCAMHNHKKLLTIVAVHA